MIKLLLTSVVLLSFSASFGQDYIVTIKSDTIKGDIKLMSYDLLDRLQLAEAGKKKVMYTALQVRRVSFKGDLYAPVKIDNSIRFMKILQTGNLSLFAYRAPQQAGYDTKVLQKVGMNGIEVPNMGFKKLVGDMVEDCASLHERSRTAISAEARSTRSFRNTISASAECTSKKLRPRCPRQRRLRATNWKS
ncbi:MAG: hypothetical protein WDO15_08125 [Bacteroidota bacterium]